MADDKEKEIEVDIEIDGGEKEIEVSIEPESKDKDKGGDDKFADLKTQLDDLKRKNEASEQATLAAQQTIQQRDQELAYRRAEVEEARTSAADRELMSVVNAISAANAEGEAAAADLREATEKGDFPKMVEAQRRMNRADAVSVQFERDKASIEATMKASKTEAKERPQRQAPADQFEASVQNMTPRTQSWLREHKECLSDPKMHRKMMAAHYEAVADDFVPDSDAYFDFVNKKLGYTKDSATTTNNKRTPFSAPVDRRDTAVSQGKLGGTVRLSPREVQTALDLGISNKEYARRKAIMMDDGRYHNNAQ